jgi:nucleotidyltransferase/DNA polymerase involved in DNA repair
MLFAGTVKAKRSRRIVHLDADAFFVSVEQAADPALRGRAVAVGGEKRGVICSASYEARRLGVWTPMPTAQARRVCPGLIVLPGDFAKYELFSRLMFSFVYDFTPQVEVGSIDEGYFDLGGSRLAERRGALAVAAAIRRAVGQTLKISISEGVATNKLVAQIASKLEKPQVLREVPPGEEARFLEPLPVTWLPGVGPVLGQSLREAGLVRIGQLARLGPGPLALFLGRGAEQAVHFARGEDDRAVVPDPPEAKSLSQQETFAEDCTDEAEVERVLWRMAEGLCAKLRGEGRCARTLTVRVRYNDFAESSRSRSLDEPTNLETEMRGVVSGLLRQAWERRVSLRLVSLKCSRLYAATDLGELPLGEAARNAVTLHRAAAAMDAIRGRYGRRAIVRGYELRPVRPRSNKELCSRVAEEEPAPEDASRTEKDHPLPPRPPLVRVMRATSRPGILLHGRSFYSFLDSLLAPSELVRLAAEAGCPAVGLCDPNLHGALEFCQAARATGVRPLLGAEVDFPGGRRLVFVQNQTGYGNLCRLLSEPAITRDFWQGHRDGLLVLRENHAPVRTARAEEARMLRMVQSIRTRTLLDTRHPEKSTTPSAFPGADEWPEWQPEPLRREAERVLAETDFSFETGRLWFPSYDPSDGSHPREFLRYLAREGLRRRYGERASRYQPQLETELSMIAEVGYEEYFLTVWDVLQECRRAGIAWITRGSAADSLVCYSLGISEVCPIRFELYFQRFLNPERMKLNKLPDIDLDFPHDRKDDVVELLFRRHPAGLVAIVGGFSTFQARSAVAEIGKVLGLAEHQVRRLTEHFPAYSRAAQSEEAARGTLAAAGGLFAEEPAATALRLARRLDGMPRYPKMHPCGVVLSRRPIHDLTPTFRSEKGWPTTHFDMDAVEEVGLVKLDILAQGGLAVLRDAKRSSL